jgi:hypothetical protein
MRRLAFLRSLVAVALVALARGEAAQALPVPTNLATLLQGYDFFLANPFAASGDPGIRAPIFVLN